MTNSIQKTALRIAGGLLCLMPAALAFAQQPTARTASRPPQHTLADLVLYPPALAWLIGITLAAWLFSAAIVYLFSARSYPPLIARVASWLGCSFWGCAVTFYVIGSVLKIGLPIYAVVIVLCLLLTVGVLLIATRPAESR